MREIQSMDSTYALCYVGLGRIRFAQGKFDEAVSQYRKAVRLDVGLRERRVRRGSCPVGKNERSENGARRS